jgi:hypothetical protein
MATSTKRLFNVVAAFSNTHWIESSLSENSALLFSTTKGISNGDPTEGGPGAKTGSVGQGGPKKPRTNGTRATTAAAKPAPTLDAVHGNRDAGGRWDIGGTGFCGVDFFCLDLLTFRGDFFTECASVFCGCFCASASRYRITEYVIIHAVVISELKLRNV